MRVSLIVAMAKNRVIGINNELPWHLPADLKHFKALTTGNPILMGRKTFDSIGRPLPGRRNIVLTRNSDWQAEGVETVSDLADCLDSCRDTVGELFIIGGEQIYGLAFPFADRIYLTEVDLTPEGDAYFPEFAGADWQQVSEDPHAAEGGKPAYSFKVFDRIKA